MKRLARDKIVLIAKITIEVNRDMILTTDDAFKEAGTVDRIYVDYKKLPECTSIGKYIYVDDGQLRLQVLEKGKDFVKVRALNTWKISNNKGVNLPMVC